MNNYINIQYNSNRIYTSLVLSPIGVSQNTLTNWRKSKMLVLKRAILRQFVKVCLDLATSIGESTNEFLVAEVQLKKFNFETTSIYACVSHKRIVIFSHRLH